MPGGNRQLIGRGCPGKVTLALTQPPQLAQAKETTPWIAGRFVQSGQAFKLETLTEADARLVNKALKSLA
jgi:hypothetical protein